MAGNSLFPPGVSFLLRGLTISSLPPFAVIVLYRLSNTFLGLTLPLWILTLACLLSSPVTLTIYVWHREWKYKREAAAQGAIMVPRWQGQSFANLDILAKLVESFNNGYPGDAQWDPFNKLGHIFDFLLFWKSTVMTMYPEHIQIILATAFENHEKGPAQHRMLGSVLGTGVFNSDGEMWKFHRSMTRPFFSRDRVVHFDIFDAHADTVISKLKARFHEGYAVDFQDLIQRFTLDAATEFLCGTCLHSLATELPYPYDAPHLNKLRKETDADKFVKGFVDAQAAIAIRYDRGWMWPFWEIFQDKSVEAMKHVNAFLEPVLTRATEKAKSMPPKDEKSRGEFDDDDTLIDNLVRYTSDRTILRDETLNILLAGRDTTAGTLTWMVYLLAQHPHVMARLREEILDKVGPTERPTYEDIRDLKYLRAVINETLRLYPAVPFNVRISKKAAVWPNPDPNGKPLYIPPGTWIMYTVFMMHRRPEYWGPDAEQFDPDRFLDERLHKYLTPNPFIFLPFNAGPRICLGQQFAYNEMSFFMVRLLQRFSKFTLDLEAQPPEGRAPAHWADSPSPRQAAEQIVPKAYLTMCALGGLWVKMEESNFEVA